MPGTHKGSASMCPMSDIMVALREPQENSAKITTFINFFEKKLLKSFCDNILQGVIPGSLVRVPKDPGHRISAHLIGPEVQMKSSVNVVQKLL